MVHVEEMMRKSVFSGVLDPADLEALGIGLGLKKVKAAMTSNVAQSSFFLVNGGQEMDYKHTDPASTSRPCNPGVFVEDVLGHPWVLFSFGKYLKPEKMAASPSCFFCGNRTDPVNQEVCTKHKTTPPGSDSILLWKTKKDKIEALEADVWAHVPDEYNALAENLWKKTGLDKKMINCIAERCIWLGNLRILTKNRAKRQWINFLFMALFDLSRDEALLLYGKLRVHKKHSDELISLNFWQDLLQQKMDHMCKSSTDSDSDSDDSFDDY